jgi:hypothetical protein
MTRLHFHDLAQNSRERMRRNVLSRLISGSSGHIYTLDSGGQRALPFILASEKQEQPERARKPWTPGQAFLLHGLDVSELYVRLVELERAGAFILPQFLTEPASWFPNGLGGILKPDAYALLQFNRVEDAWAIEVDRATESIPTLRRKLLAYVDFAHAGGEGPDGITPRVLVTVPHPGRLAAVQRLIDDLPEPAGRLFRSALFADAARLLALVLRE